MVNVKRIGGGGADWSPNTTINPCGRGQTNNLPSRLALGQGGGGGGEGGEVELLLLIIRQCNHGNRNGDQDDGCRCANCRCEKKMTTCVMVREKSASLYQQVAKAMPCDKGDGGGRLPPLITQQSICVGVTTEQYPCLIRRLD